MKKLVALLSVFVLFLAVMPTQAQTTSSEPKLEDYMTPEQLVEFQKDVEIAQLEKKLETYGNWVGVGGEVGSAIEEGLSAVVGVADQFGSTDVGKFTMILIAWKVIGKDTVRILLGLLFFALITWLFLKVYKGYYRPKKVATKKVPFLKRFVESVEYQIIEPDKDWEGVNAIPIVMLILYAGAVGITYAIMFA